MEQKDTMWSEIYPMLDASSIGKILNMSGTMDSGTYSGLDTFLQQFYQEHLKEECPKLTIHNIEKLKGTEVPYALLEYKIVDVMITPLLYRFVLSYNLSTYTFGLEREPTSDHKFKMYYNGDEKYQFTIDELKSKDNMIGIMSSLLWNIAISSKK